MENSSSALYVVKVGTNVLTKKNGELNQSCIDNVIKGIAYLKSEGLSVVLVSSGAVGMGRGELSLKGPVDKITQRQVLSAVGQSRLMQIYREGFEKHNLCCAQVLVTQEDFGTSNEGTPKIDCDNHFNNMKNCVKGLLEQDIVPILNENDVVALDELMFTDNDELAGLVSLMLDAEKLILMTSVDGIMSDMDDDDEGEIIEEIKPDQPKKEIDQHITTEKSSQGRGGMQSKIDTAFTLRQAGISTFIVNGQEIDALQKIHQGEPAGTWVQPEEASPDKVLQFSK